MLSPIADSHSMLNQRDKEIALKMRSDNYEKFKSLVRMHLSFELELNTEEFDLPCNEYIYYEKGKMKKWNPTQKNKIKGCTSTNSNKSPSDISSIQLTMDLITRLQKLKKYILIKDNIKQEGIFRRGGAVSRQNELRSLLTKKDNIDLNIYSVHDCATVFKSILGDLCEPLLTDAHYSVHCQIADLCKELGKQDNGKKENHILNIVQILILLLPKENSYLLANIIEMLNTTAKYEKFNKMSPDTLATLFSPHLICPRNLPPEALHYISQNMTPVISFLISQGMKIFDIPPKLATDIWAYYEVKRKRTMSPEYTLDESISDVSTVNTVYTFVDREKTKEANNSNPTDQALASLYAHIQGLPESSKKRKLIKQFNKENGHGTPLQVLRKKNAQRTTKSISDSIKRHIFHKTPKRSHSSSTTNISTPNCVPAKNPKMRVLFQSPLPYECGFNNMKNATSTLTKELKKTEENKKSIFDKQENKFSTLFEKSLSEKNKSEDLYQSTEFLSSPNNSDLKSKHKSEPNLTQIFNEDDVSTSFDLHNSNGSSHNSFGGGNSFGASLKNKLIKGVSMGNLRFSFMTPETTNTVKRAASLFIKAKSSTNTVLPLNEGSSSSEYGQTIYRNNLTSFQLPEESTDEFNSTNDNSIQNFNLFHNIGNFNTPLQNRLSISPITKSTQRMPKSMQESIMTPRSRKPVMLAAISGTSGDQNKSNEMDFNELDEDSFMKNNLEHTGSSFANNISQNNQNTLSSDFKEYLLSRSVITDSPNDESVSSQSDNYCSMEMDDIHNSDITQSLLYCLDGNHPDEADSNENALNDCLTITEYPEETSL